METFSSIISTQLRRSFVWCGVIAFSVLSARYVLDIHENHLQMEKLVMNHVSALSQAATFSQDIFAIQKEISRFTQSLNDTQDYQTQLEVRIGDKLVGNGGTGGGSLFGSEIRRAEMLPSGDRLVVVARIDHAKKLLKTFKDFLVLLFFGFFGFFVFHRIMQRSVKNLSDSLSILSQWIEESSRDLPSSLDQSPPQLKIETWEFERLIQSWNIFASESKKTQKRLTELNSAKAEAEIAAQVSHDIRSPLAIILSIVNGSNEVQEPARTQLQSAATRLREIANQQLAQKNKFTLSSKESPESFAQEMGELTSVDVRQVTESIVSQMQVQYAKEATIRLTCSLRSVSFIRVAVVEFERVLANLINNAVEAYQKNPSVELGVEEEKDFVLISIKDAGKGIPQDVLRKIGARGVTVGKVGGSGLGVYHAKTSVETWGGELEINSEVGLGTCVKMRIPKAAPPDWFLESLRLGDCTTVVILDDDESVHDAWKRRFAEGSDKLPLGLTIEHFYSKTEILNWYRNHLDQVHRALYLCDYSLSGSKETGTEIIEMLGIGASSVLVTGKGWDPQIRDQCIKLGIKILEKDRISSVRIDP